MAAEEVPGPPRALGTRRSNPLLDRIRQREASPISAGISVLLGISSPPVEERPATGAPGEPAPEAGAEPQVPPPSPGNASPEVPVAAAGQVAEAPEDEEPSRLNRGALLSRLQGTHQANLHRGFYALLNTGVAAVQAVVTAPEAPDAADYRVVLMDVSFIDPNPHLPPVPTDGDAQALLVQSIREQGILEPLQVHPAPSETGAQESGRYWIIAGERRRRAAIAAGLQQVPVIIKDVAPRAGLQMFLSQSIHTYRLSMLDHARVYRTLITEMGMTPVQIASRIGAQVEDVEAEIAFLEFEAPIQDSLRDGRLTPRQARVLLQAPDRTARHALWEYALRYRPNPERMRERMERRFPQ